MTRGICHKKHGNVIKIVPAMHLTVTGSSTWRLVFNFRIVYLGLTGHCIFTSQLPFHLWSILSSSAAAMVSTVELTEVSLPRDSVSLHSSFYKGD
jgi:hypothetical protein